MKNKLELLQVQKQILAPVMQQSITVLLLSIMDLNLAIEQELQNNPLLESPEESPTGSSVNTEIQKSIDAFFHKESRSTHVEGDDEEFDEKPISKEPSLEEYLLRQLHIEISDEFELKIGELIIGNIDEDGYLKITCEEIAAILGIHDISLIERVLAVVQKLDPIGIAARNLQECLLIQMKAKNQNGAITSQIINVHLESLGKKQYRNIAKQLSISTEEVRKIANWISKLEPRPARNFRPISSNIYIKPDISIIKNPEGEYQVQIVEDNIPQLRINPIYQNMLKRKGLKEDERIFIRKKMEDAIHFIKSIEQRGQTLREIAKYILSRQKDFFDGQYLSIAPMTLKDVASAIDRNESTVSRAINNKYIDTPQGLFPLKFFFSQAIETSDNTHTSSQSIKEEIKEIVDHENKSSPFSDHDIQNHFEQKGVHLARRTITKYRKVLCIPPSYLRKQIK